MVFGRKPEEMDLGLPSDRPQGIPGPSDRDADATGSKPLGGPYVPGRVVLSLFTVAVLAAAGFMFATLESRAVKDPVKKAERGEISAESPFAMTDERNFRRALRAIDAQLRDGGFVDMVRLAPTNVQATIVQPDGQSEALTINLAFDVTVRVSGVDDDETGLQPSDIDAAAPTKILRVAGRKFSLWPQYFDYLVIRSSSTPSTPPLGWTGFWTRPLRNNDVAAAADGTDVRLLGTPDAATRRQTRESQAAAARALRESEQRGECLRQAQTREALTRCVS